MKNEAMVQKTISWIEMHLCEPLRADDVANAIGLSKYYLHRIFQRSTGMSCTDYIRMRRLANAASTLIHSNERIIDIALHYQFESQESFTRAFKKLYHLPPGKYRKAMRVIQRYDHEEEVIMEEKIKGWFLSGSHPFNYEIGIDRRIAHQGKASGYLRSKTVQDPQEFATMMQEFKADNYRGKRLKLSGYIKAEQVEQFSGLWMRVDSASEDVLQFDNMSNRPITGTQNWNHYSIILDIPENSATISFGILLSGKGCIWADQLTFTEVGLDIPTTNIEINRSILEEPTNLSFEDEL